jgi:hypothetical protein
MGTSPLNSNKHAPPDAYRESLIADEIRSLLSSSLPTATVLNEAEFGYRQIQRHLDSCRAGAKILEVGSGACVLLSQLKLDYPAFDVTGIEPVIPPTIRRD